MPDLILSIPWYYRGVIGHYNAIQETIHCLLAIQSRILDREMFFNIRSVQVFIWPSAMTWSCLVHLPCLAPILMSESWNWNPVYHMIIVHQTVPCDINEFLLLFFWRVNLICTHRFILLDFFTHCLVPSSWGFSLLFDHNYLPFRQTRVNDFFAIEHFLCTHPGFSSPDLLSVNLLVILHHLVTNFLIL